MDKKALSALPMPEVEERYNDLRRMYAGMRGIVTAERVDVGGEDTLVVNCFRPKGKDRVEPWFRTFCQNSGYASQDFTGVKAKWRTATFAHIAGYYIDDGWRTDSRLVLASPEDGEEVIRWMKGWMERNRSNRCDAGYVFDDYIHSYQADLLERRLEEKRRKVREKIDRRMGLFGGLPEDYQGFVERRVFGGYDYFFYSLKDKIAYCTRCGHEYEVRKGGVYHKDIPVWSDKLPKHNDTYICPYCSSPIVAKCLGYGRGRLIKASWSVLVQPSGSDVLVRYIRHTKDFRGDFRRPEIKSVELYRTIHAATSAEAYDWGMCPYGQGAARWRYAKGAYAWNATEFQAPRSVMLYNEDFGFLSGTCMRYSCIGTFLREVVPRIDRRDVSAWVVDKYFNFYRKNPCVEKMLKIGWYRLVKELFDGIWRSEWFREGKDGILEACGITRAQFRLVRDASGGNPDTAHIRIAKHAEEKGVRLTVDDLQELHMRPNNGWINHFDRYLDAMRYTTLHKLLRYLDRQRIRIDDDYFDYFGWLLEMGYDMRNESNLYPRDFRRRHDEMAIEYQAYKDEKHREEAMEFDRALQEMRKEAEAEDGNPENLHMMGLFIRLPYRVEELKKEGEALHHCVGTYVDRIMRGETTILFIRRESMPDEPYYTLEWSGHRVIQCRGMRNCDMTADVKAFATVFAEKMREYEARKEVQALGA